MSMEINDFIPNSERVKSVKQPEAVATEKLIAIGKKKKIKNKRAKSRKSFSFRQSRGGQIGGCDRKIGK